MDCKFINFVDLEKDIWNSEILKMEGHLHLISENSLKYFSAFEGIQNKSFLVEVEKEIVAAFAVGLNRFINKKKKSIYGFHFNYIPSCPAPVFKNNLKPSTRRKIINTSLEHIAAIDSKVKQINLFCHPINFNKKSKIDSKNQFELIKYSDSYSVVNNYIVDLNRSKEDLLNNLSKYHRRNIKRSIDKLDFNIYDAKDEKILKNKFDLFKNIHYQSAGRLTRPEKTWDLMFESLQNNSSKLYSVSLKKKDISFLYCGNYLDFSWGWSQANIEEFEKDYMPRHVLEWQTILHLKKNKFKYYDLGETYLSKNSKVSKKDISISEFKEKFGSDIYPKSFFTINL